ncbi:hypothetical protein LCGC14_1634750 [marine sediment metagenome]|uniref:Uncharacterized protein n=1 Tax=marine sediment metagenome TaxID=412755 RepID=A0A0F9INV0_9ZZZZ
MRLLGADEVYLDPSFNMKNGRIERPRHQFRVTYRNLSGLYQNFDTVDVTGK